MRIHTCIYLSEIKRLAINLFSTMHRNRREYQAETLSLVPFQKDINPTIVTNEVGNIFPRANSFSVGNSKRFVKILIRKNTV